MRLIYNADDFGYSDAVSLGIIKAHRDGVLKSTTMMSNMDSAPFAAKLAKENPGLYVGQHTNIVVGSPCCNPSLIPSLVDENGYFNVKQRLERGEILDKDDIRRETMAQAERFKELMGYYPTHIEGHAVCDPGLKIAVREVSTELKVHYTDNMSEIVDGKINVVKETNYSGYEIPNEPDVVYYKERVSLRYWYEDIGNILSKELVEIHCHPGYIDQELIDSSSYTIERALEVRILCSQEFRKWIETNEIEMITFEDIMRV